MIVIDIGSATHGDDESINALINEFHPKEFPFPLVPQRTVSVVILLAALIRRVVRALAPKKMEVLYLSFGAEAELAAHLRHLNELHVDAVVVVPLMQNLGSVIERAQVTVGTLNERMRAVRTPLDSWVA